VKGASVDPLPPAAAPTMAAATANPTAGTATGGGFTLVDPTSIQYTVADRASLAEFQRSAMQLLRDNTQLQHVVLKVRAHDRTLHTLVGKTAECPKVVWFYPKKPELRDWLSNPMKCLLQAPLMMVVVCPVTFCVVPCGPDGAGWEVAMPKKWVKEWGPAILFSIYVLQAAVVAGRVVGIPLPPMPDTKVVKEALGLKGMLGSAFSKGVNPANLSDSLSSFADTTKAALDLNPDLQSLCEGLQQPNAAAGGGQALSAHLPGHLPMHLVGEAYKSIHKFLLTFGPLEDQLRGRMERVMPPDGDVEWVSIEGKEAWLQKHAAMVSEQQHQTPLPVSPARSVPAENTVRENEPPRSWLTVKLAARGTSPGQVTVCERALVEQEGFTTEASLAALPAHKFTDEYLSSVGITAMGAVGQLLALHPELHAQYSAASSPAPSNNSPHASPAFTPDEVGTLKAELRKLQKPPAGGGGGVMGGLMQKQAQCNVVIPAPGSPTRRTSWSQRFSFCSSRARATPMTSQESPRPRGRAWSSYPLTAVGAVHLL
jgi:hypothetical protein